MMRSLTAACLLLAAAPGADACRICFPLPKQSLADRLIESDSVILAREDPKRPFHYGTIEVLRGAAPEAPLELFVDTGTRRILRASPERSVLIAKRRGGTWRRLAMMDKELLATVRTILERSVAWQRNPQARFDYFTKSFASEHGVLRELAHLEIARAPYADLRRFGKTVPRETLLAALAEHRYLEWWALHILLLGQSRDARDRKLIERTVRSLERLDRPMHLGAWATAYIEVDPRKAIAFLEERYGRRKRSLQELREVLLALSVQGGAGDRRMRDRVVAAYLVLLDNEPVLASPVLDDLIAWKRGDLAPRLHALAKRHARAFPPDARLKLKRLASRAE